LHAEAVCCVPLREPVMDKFVNTGLVRHVEVPDCKCHGGPVNIFDGCVVELEFVLQIGLIVQGDGRMSKQSGEVVNYCVSMHNYMQ